MSYDERKRHRRSSRDRSAEFNEKRQRRSRDAERIEERLKVKIKEEPQSEDERPPQRNRRPDDGYNSRRGDERTDRDRREPRYDRQDRGRRSPREEMEKQGQKTFEWGKQPIDKIKTEDEPEKPKEKPNFGLSGNLAKDTNMFNGVVIKYNEPPEARKPKLHWRLYPFKGDEPLDFIPVYRQSAYLLGRDRRIADIPVDHPSCSKQHAVLQYRFIKRTLEDGTLSRRVRPYIIDLGSANGTYVNSKRIDSERYFELFEKDVIKFGFSSREYVLLHENSQDDADADDGNEDTEADTEKQKSP